MLDIHIFSSKGAQRDQFRCIAIRKTKAQPVLAESQLSVPRRIPSIAFVKLLPSEEGHLAGEKSELSSGQKVR